MAPRRHPPRTSLDAGLPGAFHGETVTRRRVMTGGAHAPAAIAGAAVVLPAAGFSQLRRFSPRDSGEPLDGIGQYLYPPRFTTAKAPH
jgi:menaquinol-cytochrome c reductase iron-sulfur subunit